MIKTVDAWRARHQSVLPATNKAQHAARKAVDPVSERAKGLVKQVDHLYKLAARAAQLAPDAAKLNGAAEKLDRRALNKLIKALEEERRGAVEQLKQIVYFHRQVAWLQDHFPRAEMEAVPGLCKVVSRKEIEKADWGLTPGRYVGVAPPEVDGDFDFQQAVRELHAELAELNLEAADLARTIQEHLAELSS